ncbi:hypothetical protein RN001_005955 [Aquatica leii]|uniref:acireductone dioxygenase (Fe(2+)-requiring) n=1 Tax=Aquatica leii TaxID=1421715 RepID=A0AAN7PKJ9_9COLE|nr:hypothetical protein RN001_005955 [Aquatica leii]
MTLLFLIKKYSGSQLNVDTYKADGLLDKIRIQRHYTYEDEVVCTKEALPEYEKTMQKFFTEHLHPDEEIRFILDGSGYFDVRDKNDEWIRIEATTGDMLVIPRGIYHRFTLDMKDFIKAKRLFSGDTPVWTAFFRPADDMQCRKDYLERMKAGFTAPLIK